VLSSGRQDTQELNSRNLPARDQNIKAKLENVADWFNGMPINQPVALLNDNVDTNLTEINYD